MPEHFGYLSERQEQGAWRIFAILMACLFGALTASLVFEYDIFWQIRAGREIFETAQVQTMDTWSFTARGAPWYNFQWLSCLVCYWVSLISHSYASMCFLRVTLVAICFGGIASIIRRVQITKERAWICALILMPWIHREILHRIQMRPDLFGTMLYPFLILLWLSDFSATKKRLFGLGILVLWANFHNGTAPFGMIIQLAAIALAPMGNGDGEEPWHKKLGWLGATCLTLIATPIHYHVFDAMLHLAFRYDPSKTGNADQQPFRWDHLKQWMFLLWPPYTLLSFWLYTFLPDKVRAKLGPYKNRLFTYGLGIFLTAFTIHRIRVVHYQMMFLLPVIAAGLGALDFSKAKSALRNLRWWTFATLIVFFWAYIIPSYVIREASVFGSSVPDWMIPIKAVEFIKRTQPARNLLNPFTYGGYLIGELPDYPVSSDGRELMFAGPNEELRLALQGDPNAYQELLNRWSIGTVMDTYAHRPLLLLKDVGYVDPHRIYYPPERWALVYFDSVVEIFLKRIPENAAIINAFEYKFVRPGMPYEFVIEEARIDDQFRAQYELEIDRCLGENPRNNYCLMTKSALLKKRGDLNGALEFVRRAEAVDDFVPEVYTEFERLYTLQGREPEARAAHRRFESLIR